MPHRPRAGTAGLVFHVLNRGVRRATLFEADAEYNTFLRVLVEAQQRRPLRLLAYCVMPNHFHFVVWPRADDEMSLFMQWFTATHSKRWHVDRGTTGTGSVYQSRFKAFPIQADGHFLTVCRYVERNPVRAGLVRLAEEWRWSSCAERSRPVPRVHLSPWPVPLPPDWPDQLNQVDREAEVRRVRRSVVRSAPFGVPSWAMRIGARLGAVAALRPLGRPARELACD